MPKKIHWGPDLWQVDERTQCWVWKGSSNQGRAKFGSEIAGRHALGLWLGRPVKKALVVASMCLDGMCVNPHHLYEDSYSGWRQSLRNGGVLDDNNAFRRCAHGHILVPRLRYEYNGRVHCRACRLDRVHQWRERQRAA